MSILFFDVEVVFYADITKMAFTYGVDEKKIVSGRFGPIIDASTRYISNISYKRDKGKIVSLSILGSNEKQLLSKFIKEWNNSDEVVAWYGEKFDWRFLNSRIERHNLPLLKPVKFIDPWKILKNNFLLPNNKLSTAINFFKCPYGKPNLSWSVWQEASFKDKQALKLLTHRCKYDVLSMAWIYYKHLEKYTSRRVNKALAYERIDIDDQWIETKLKTSRCPRCAVKGKMGRNGYRYSKVSTLMQFICHACFEYPSASIRKNGKLGVIS